MEGFAGSFPFPDVENSEVICQTNENQWIFKVEQPERLKINASDKLSKRGVPGGVVALLVTKRCF